MKIAILTHNLQPILNCSGILPEQCLILDFIQRKDWVRPTYRDALPYLIMNISHALCDEI